MRNTWHSILFIRFTPKLTIYLSGDFFSNSKTERIISLKLSNPESNNVWCWFFLINFPEGSNFRFIKGNPLVMTSPYLF